MHSTSTSSLIHFDRFKQEIVVSEENCCAISLKNVTIETPSGQMLMEGLTVDIKHGQHTFIKGPNGVGKTSIFRIIAGLWTPKTGNVEIRSDNKRVFFLSQRPYLVPHRSFKHQLNYPERAGTFTESELRSVFQFVGIDALIASRGGLDDERAVTGLSGGELQRIGMARCLLHRPRFALLDECSSAVSVDMTDKFFTECVRQKITLITIAHDAALEKYHTQTLEVAKDGWKVVVH